MMINLSLLARLHAIQTAFNRDIFKEVAYAAPIQKINTNTNDLTLKNLAKKKEDEDGKGGDSSGGSTAKGLRGKNDLNPIAKFLVNTLAFHPRYYHGRFRQEKSIVHKIYKRWPYYPGCFAPDYNRDCD